MAKSKERDEDAMREMRERYKEASEFWSPLFKLCADDVRFVWVPGNQWDKETSKNRKGRPKYEFDKLRPAIKQVTNDQRQNNPQIKVRAEQDAKKDDAELFNGLIRNIEASSRADVAFDTAGFFAATGGFGALRITTEYSDDSAFEQDIVFKEIRNPFSVKLDPHAKEFDRRDGRFAFVELSYSRDEFKHRWPDADFVDFSQQNASRSYGDWFTEKEVRVVEYWCKHHDKKTIHLLSDGRVVDASDFDPIADELANPPIDQMTGMPAFEPVTVVRSRDVNYDRITMSLCSGADVLEGPFEWAGKFIPIIPVWGDSLNVEGEEVFYGIARPARDAQVLFNYNMSVGHEAIARSPNAPFLFTPKMIEGHEAAWAGLATDNAPGLPYNVDNNAPGGMPKRQDPPTFPAALFNAAQFCADQIKAVTSIYDASLGARSNETSGKAINARASQGKLGNFDYTDNLARAKRYAGEILVDLIPKIYDTEREVMILGDDGKEKYVKINQTVIDQQTGEQKTINDLSAGKFGVTVSVGPSYTTQRMELAEAMLQLSNTKGPDAAIARYIAIKSMDIPGADEMVSALRRLLVQQGLLERGEQDGPPQVPPPPDPRIIADVKLKEAQAAKVDAETKAALAILPSKMQKSYAEADHMAAQAFSSMPGNMPTDFNQEGY